MQWLESFSVDHPLTVHPWDGTIRAAEFWKCHCPIECDLHRASHPRCDKCGDDSRIRLACILDTETTGLDPRAHSIIEIGLRTIAYSPAGEVLGLVDSYDGLQDPGAPLPAEIAALTGLTDMDLAGEAIDWERVAGMLKAASVTAAHHSRFDRPFVDAALRAWATQYGLTVPRAAWACSLDLIDWRGHGLPSSSLEALCALHGFYTTSHRAGSDAAALARLLGMRNAETRVTYLFEMLETARVPTVRVKATGSPFSAKDALYRRDYRWDASRKVWWTEIAASDVDEELAALGAIYSGGRSARVTKVDMWSRYAGDGR